MCKAKSQRIHAKKRAAERFGIELEDSAINRIITDIQSNRTEFLCKESNRISVHLIDLAGKLVRCVYDKERKEIVTFMPFNSNTCLRKH